MRSNATFIPGIFLAAALALPGATPAFASDAVIPERRVVVVEDMDFYGGDLGSIFNTTLDACQSACVGDRSCRAFTYNTRS